MIQREAKKEAARHAAKWLEDRLALTWPDMLLVHGQEDARRIADGVREIVAELRKRATRPVIPRRKP